MSEQWMSVDTALPLATQTLESTKGKESIRRSATCPLHNKKTSKWIAPNKNDAGERHWVFECEALKTPENRATHMFAALVPRDAPETIEEVLAWMRTQRDARLKVMSRTQS